MKVCRIVAALLMALTMTIVSLPASAGELDAMKLASGPQADAATPDEQVDASGWEWSRLAPSLIGLASYVVPGAGQAINMNYDQALLGFGIAVGSLALGEGDLRSDAPRLPILFPDTDQKQSILILPAQWAVFCSTYYAYKQAEARFIPEKQIKVREVPFWDLMLSPWMPENLLDWQNWAAVGALLASNLVVNVVLPPEPVLPGPVVFEARSASYGGIEMPALGGFALNVLAGALVAWQAGTGEEALYRGFMQDEIERDTGSPIAAVALTSASFGAAHIGGVNQTSAARQFLGTGVMSGLLGGYYLQRDHDLRKAAAAHTYYDIVALGLRALYPTVKGNNLLGVKFTF